MNYRRQSNNFHSEEVPFGKNLKKFLSVILRGKARIMPKTLLLLNFLHTKPQVNNLNIEY